MAREVSYLSPALLFSSLFDDSLRVMHGFFCRLHPLFYERFANFNQYFFLLLAPFYFNVVTVPF
jgi:hypothetical protein